MTDKEIQELLYAAPCTEFAETIRKISETDKARLRALAKYQGVPLGQRFVEKLHFADGVKAGSFAHDLAERALLLSEDPADFAEIAGTLDCTCALLPHIPNDRFKENNLSLPICGVAGMAADLLRPMYQKYSRIRAYSGDKSTGSYLLFGMICLVLAGLVLLHPASSAFFAGEWLYKGLVILGSIITVAMIFITGLVGAIVFMVVYAGVMSFLDGLLPLGLLVRIILALIPAAGSVALFVNFNKGRKRQAVYKRARAAAAGLVEDAEEAQEYFALCLVRLEAYHKWLADCDAVEYEKAEKALQYYRSARDWAKKFVRAFDNGF